jgi:Uma2 family endonuclease
MRKTIIKIGPADNGRRMSLEEFEDAEGQEGYLYELSRGIVTVSDVPKRLQLFILAAIKTLLYGYSATWEGRIQMIAGGSECKLLIDEFDSERHPDISVYLSPPPEQEDKNFWRRWVPELVIEVVSASSRKRDYNEKPAEYLRIGVKEYWIVDPDKRALVAMRRVRGRWVKRTIMPPAVYKTTLLPDLEIAIATIFQQAGLT